MPRDVTFKDEARAAISAYLAATAPSPERPAGDGELRARVQRWRGVYAVDGIGKVAPDELPPDIEYFVARIIDAESARSEAERERDDLRETLELHSEANREANARWLKAEAVIEAARAVLNTMTGSLVSGPHTIRELANALAAYDRALSPEREEG